MAKDFFNRHLTWYIINYRFCATYQKEKKIVMNFATDNQTLEDLNIFNGRGSVSIYSIFNKTCTRGGAALLEEMFRYPLSKTEDISNRIKVLNFFTTVHLAFPLKQESLDVVEHYLSNFDERSKLTAQEMSVAKKISNLLATDNEYQAIYKGVVCLIELLQQLNGFLKDIRLKVTGNPYAKDIELIDQILSSKDFVFLMKENTKTKLSYAIVSEYDKQLRFVHRSVIKKILQYVFYLDVYIAVAKVAMEKRFIFPTVLEKDQHAIHLQGLYHPQLTKPIANDISIYADKNIVFLTGANMAGKSTFIKSVGVATFLAHIGMGVPARSMRLSVFDGLLSNINVADNIAKGESYFYNEVQRIKATIQKINDGRKWLILIDELFKGTNVQDAMKCSTAVIEGLLKIKNALFILSTHLYEIGDELKKYPNIQFNYFETSVQDGQLHFSYQLREGISNDRLGYLILKREGVVKLLEDL